MAADAPRFAIDNPVYTGDFIGESANFYQRLLERQTGSKIVAAVSVEDAYRGALGKPNPYGGDTKDAYMQMELHSRGFIVRIAPEEEIKKLLTR